MWGGQQQPGSPREEGVSPWGVASDGALAFLLQVGDPSLGTMPSDLRRGAGATSCSLREAGPWPPCPPASLRVLAGAQAPPCPGLQSGALPCQVGPFPRR